MLHGKRALVTGGTGSLGQAVIRRLLTGEMGVPNRITVFSRDEAKQHAMRQHFPSISYCIGDVRDYPSLARAVSDCDVVINAAALKQVPTCEYFPFEAVQTNIIGPQNIVRAVLHESGAELVVGISTDKACKPINVMGMTKAIQERIFIEANLYDTRFVCVRYGNVIASRGSVVPLFKEQIARGGPVTVTDKNMTRFLLSLDRAVDTVFAAMRGALPGEIYIPKVPSAKVVDMATVLIGERYIPIKYIGILPGEKVDEILVSEEECSRTIERDGHYVIRPMLPELCRSVEEPTLTGEYSSADVILSQERLRELLEPYIS